MDATSNHSFPPQPATALLEHRAFVRALARTLVGEADADDVAQEVLLAGLKAPPRVAGSWRTWLRTTARNIACNWRRGAHRRDEREIRSARPEALPATVALVERLELEQRVVAAVLGLAEPDRSILILRFYEGLTPAAIAARMGLKADTIRARLRRALEQVRARLDGGPGGRAQWLAGLAATGVVTMGVKSATILAAACVVAAATWWAVPPAWLHDAPLDGGVERSAATPGRPVAADAPALLPAEVASVATREVVDPAADEAAGIRAADVALPPAGNVAFKVVDAEQGTLLDAVTIRFLHEQRFAEYRGGGAGSIRLTSGRWTARVTARGRDPVDLADFSLLAAGMHDLGTIALARGSGAIEGQVTARQLTGDGSVEVELIGEGRSPCKACLRGAAQDSAACCGFRDERSVVVLPGGGRFSFRHLAAGVYWLRACEPKSRLIDLRRIELGRHGFTWVDLHVTTPTSLIVELRHLNGRHFAGDWGHPHRETPAAITFVVALNDEVRAEGRITPSVEAVLATIGPPLLLEEPGGRRRPGVEKGNDQVQAGVMLDLERLMLVHSQRLHAEQAMYAEVVESVKVAGLMGGGDRLDRERQEEDALVVPGAPPTLEAAGLEVRSRRFDSFELFPLPRAELTVEVSCGHYRSGPVVVDLRFGFPGPLVVTLAAPPEEQEEVAAIARRHCSACHQSPEGDPAALERVLTGFIDEVRLEAIEAARMVEEPAGKRSRD